MPSVLIVDDHEPARFLRARTLMSAGFDIYECDSARTTLETVLSPSNQMDLVLLDVGLPDGDGRDVCERIKAAKPALPVVLISAVFRSAQARQDGKAAGADAYLVEPLPSRRLIETVSRLAYREESDTDPPVAVLHTTPGGGILSANDCAARLLNIAVRAATGRNLLMFFDGNRQHLLSELACAAGGQEREVEAVLRPRERKPFAVRIDLATAPDGGPGEIEWLIQPAAPADVRAAAPRLLSRSRP